MHCFSTLPKNRRACQLTVVPAASGVRGLRSAKAWVVRSRVNAADRPSICRPASPVRRTGESLRWLCAIQRVIQLGHDPVTFKVGFRANLLQEHCSSGNPGPLQPADESIFFRYFATPVSAEADTLGRFLRYFATPVSAAANAAPGRFFRYFATPVSEPPVTVRM